MARFGALIHSDIPLRDAGSMLEELGFDYAAIGEHIAFHVPTSQSLVGLAFLAGATSRIGLLSSVTLAPLYTPGLLAKMVAELAIASGGRFELGIGIGGEYPREFAVCGVPVNERASRTAEVVPLIRGLLSDARVTHHGKHWSFDDVSISPRPAAVPRIWVGGRRSAAISRAAAFGDVWLPYMSTAEQLRASSAEVNRQARLHGRSAVESAAFVFVCVGPSAASARETAAAVLGRMYGADMRRVADRYVVCGTPADCLDGLREYANVGARSMILSTLAHDGAGSTSMWESLAHDVIPALREHNPPDR